MTIFSPTQLRDWLRYDADAPFVEAAAQQAEKVVTGWLVAEVGAIPDQLEESSPLFAWGLELGGIAYENPTSMSDDSAGETRSTWADRRLQILASARRWAQENGTSTAHRVPAPLGTFPPPPRWPDAMGCR